MHDDLIGAQAIAAYIGKCHPTLIPDLAAQGWPIVKVGREYRSTKTAIDLYLHRRQPAQSNTINPRLVLQIEEIKDRLEMILREIGGDAHQHSHQTHIDAIDDAHRSQDRSR